ncbi:unnamed protein product [Scytosiphon promiscuus]
MRSGTESNTALLRAEEDRLLLLEEVETLRDRVRCLTDDFQQAEARANELGTEAREQSHVNSQLKQVIDQMRQVSRGYNEGAAVHAQELDEALAAKEAAEQEAASLRRVTQELQEEMEHVIRESDNQSASAQEKVSLLKQLRQAQALLDQAREDKGLSQEAFHAELASSQSLHQEALQREQQLGSQVKALQADLALASQDTARHEEALGNLRGVLEAFHAERNTEMEVLNKRRKEELGDQAASFEKREMALKSAYETQLSEQVLSTEREREKERLKQRRAEALLEGENARIKEDLLKTRAALEGALTRLSGSCDDTVDRQLVANLIVRYVTSHHKRQVLDLMARMFNFAEEEKEQVGLLDRGPSLPGILTAMFTASGAEDTEVPADAESVAGSALSDLWVDFLMAETTEDGGKPT